MTASVAKIVIEGGISALYCPVTGRRVFKEGFDSESNHSPHLRFFVNWIGEVWVAKPEDLPTEQADYQRKIIGIWEEPDEDDSQNSLIAKCADVLPSSAFILEILDPPQGSFDGEICYACFDCAQLGEGASELRLSYLGA